jgi:hypothetical protein
MNMTNILSATVRGQMASRLRKSVDFQMGNMTQILPTTSTAQVAILISKVMIVNMTIRIYKSVDFSIRSMTQELPAAARAQIAHIMSKSVEVF